MNRHVLTFSLIFAVAALVYACLVLADDVTLDWSSVAGARGYTVSQSIDGGQTWANVASTQVTSVLLHNIPNDRLVLLRVSATVGDVEAIRFEKGVFYNAKWKPASGSSPVVLNGSQQVLEDAAQLPQTSQDILRDPSLEEAR